MHGGYLFLMMVACAYYFDDDQSDPDLFISSTTRWVVPFSQSSVFFWRDRPDLASLEYGGTTFRTDLHQFSRYDDALAGLQYLHSVEIFSTHPDVICALNHTIRLRPQDIESVSITPEVKLFSDDLVPPHLRAEVNTRKVSIHISDAAVDAPNPDHLAHFMQMFDHTSHVYGLTKRCEDLAFKRNKKIFA